MGQLVDLTIV